MRASRQARALPGTLAAFIAVFAAGCSHTSAAGHAPSAFGVALSLLVGVPTAIALAGVRPAGVRLKGSVLGSPFPLHLMFSIGAGSSLPGPAGSTHAHQHSPVRFDIDVVACLT
jgi:hypothetical protein